jgi:hypothetical protein
MRRVLALPATAVVALLLAAPSPAATKHGITPLAPKAGSTVPAGKAPTFRMRVKGPGTVWVHVCRSLHKAKDGRICDKESIGRAKKRKNGTYAFKPTYYDYDGFWLNTPGTYYWQAHRISCEHGTKDCAQEGPVVKFHVA